MSATISTLREAVLETLAATLSSDATIRTSAEQQIRVFEVTDDYGSILTDIALTSGIDWSLRQLAAVLLKQYITVHWRSDSDRFDPPEVNPENKTRIKNALLSSLCHVDCDVKTNNPEKKLMSSLSFAVSSIGHFDFPEEWPQLLPTLINYITSGNPVSVYTSMKIIVEMCHEITESQVPPMIPVLLPKMLQMIRDPSNYTLRTRGRAIQVFAFVAETISILKEFDKNTIKQLLDPMLPLFMETFVQLLQMPDTAVDQVDIGMRKDVLNCLSILCKHFRPRLMKWMPSLLPVVWQSLTTSATLYVNSIVNSDSDEDSYPLDVSVDSDGESLGLDAFIFSLFEFVSVLIEHPRTMKLIKQGMTDLLYYLVIYMQMTDEQIQSWSADPDCYVQDEDEDTYSFSVRISAQDVVLSIAQEIEESSDDVQAFHTSFVEALKRHLNESNQIKTSSHSSSANNNTHSNWWKIQESCLFGLGSLSETFVQVIKQSSIPAANDLKAILDSVFMGSMDPNSQPFFVGRCIWAAGRFAPIMPPPVLDKFLSMTVSCFTSSSPAIKISATRAIYSFCCHLKEMNQQALVTPYLPGIVEGLVALGVEFSCSSSDVLGLVLDTLSIVCRMDADFTASHEAKISPLAIASFLRNSSDPVIISCCQNIFKQLSRNEKCVGALQSRLGPTLLSILNPSQENETTKALEPAALDILTSIVRSSPAPFSVILMQLFSSSVNCILKTSEDNATLQNGGECVRAYVSRSTHQVMSYRDPSDVRQGVTVVMQVCLHLLDPKVSETCSAFVGRLVSTCIVKGSHALGPDNVHLLLRSVLSKLQTSETLSVIQSLVLVFAHLIHHDINTVLDFLSCIPSPSISGGKSALEFVLSLWLSRQHLFFGSYDRKVTILSLGKLLEHSVQMLTTGSDVDPSLNLNLILVPGDPIFESSETIVTRSKSKSVNQWTQVPCSVKILKVLIAEIGSMNERDTYSEDSDEEYDDSEQLVDPPETRRQKGTGDCSHSDDEDEDDELDSDSDIDEDEANDPVSKVNISVFLSNFVKSFHSTTVFSQFLEQLTDIEKKTMSDFLSVN